jgi:hypothetical protein
MEVSGQNDSLRFYSWETGRVTTGYEAVWVRCGSGLCEEKYFALSAIEPVAFKTAARPYTD